MINVAVSELYPANPVVHEVLIVLEVERRHQGYFTITVLDDLLLLPTFMKLFQISCLLLFISWIKQNTVLPES